MTDDPIDAEKAERALELARAAVNRQQPDQAIALVDSLRLRGDEVGFERHWAESRLLLAEAYLSKGDPSAEGLFDETFALLAQLPQSEIGLEIRANEHWGDYLRCFIKRPSLARSHYEIAKRRSVELHMEEDSARIQLKIEAIELGMDNSSEVENFKTLKRAAKQGGYTAREQLAAWLHHKGELSNIQEGLKFARNRAVATELYFRHLLDMVRQKP
jgi:hypothetical protein